MSERFTPTTPPDEALLARWCEGDTAAGNELIKRYLRPLRLYLGSKLAAEDDVQELTQATFVACVELQGQPERRLEGVASFRAYLFGIARHKLLHFYGRRPALAGNHDIAAMPLADLSPGPSTLIKLHERVDTLMLAMAALSIDQQTAIQLQFWHGLSQQEVADALGVPAGTVARRIHDAKRKLLDTYAKLDGRAALDPAGDALGARGELGDEELRQHLSAIARRLL